ncbi:MAG: FtsQ-type POTRA domain-containing protein [Candidatus Pacebacteria bacterium]|nr:FtsQ-type POTRA domain-containing protein [Candidatus Paceibacterota bacterium]
MLFRRRRVRSEKLVRRRRQVILARLGVTILMVLILVGGASWLLHNPAITLTDVVIQGNHVVSDEEILRVVDKTLAGSYLLIFPRRSSLVYPERELSQRLLEDLPRIKSVELVRVDPHTLSIEVREQQPSVLWCRESAEGALDECYFVNEDGFVYAPAPNFTGNVFFRFYGDIVADNPVGEHVWGSDFDRVMLLIGSLGDLNMVPVALRPLDRSDVRLEMEDGSAILFGRKQRPSEVIDNLNAVLGSETFEGVLGEDIDYIDLRFGNKVYFKLR